jgi:hypothetical protein
MMELQIVAQSILAEMAAKINTQASYYATLTATFDEYAAKEQALVEMCCSTWHAAMELVAKQAGIKIDWRNGNKAKAEPKSRPALRQPEAIYKIN